VRIEESSSNIVRLSVIRTSRRRASSPYGPVRAGLTTLPRTDKDLQLTELLNSLEKKVESLNYKSFTVYDTLVIAIEEMRALLSDILIEEDGTDV
jgi:hypothetical protein